MALDDPRRRLRYDDRKITEPGMRIYTVTQADRPLAVVRAASSDEAIDTAIAMAAPAAPVDAFDVREPSDAEMVGWIERRADYLLTETATVA
jgi:hypothetical protein